MANRDFDRGARRWGYDEPYGRGEWEGGRYGGRYGTDEPYFRGVYTGAGYGPGSYTGDYIREGGPGAYAGGGYYGGGRAPYYGREGSSRGGYFGWEPFDRYERDRFDRENYGWYGDAYGRGPYAGGWGREAGRESYFGRGPRGYRRSDERIREEVNDRLTWHPDIDASEIEVTVENAEVTLTGVVEDRRAKRLAADLADDVLGVQDVHNQLKVRHGFLAGLTGEKADEREVSRAADREGSEGPARRGTRTGATAGAAGSATETGKRGT
jgi:hypothetical protein